MNMVLFVGGILTGALVIGAWTHWSLPAEVKAPKPAAVVEAPRPRPAPVLLAQVELRDLAALAVFAGSREAPYAYWKADQFMAARGPATPAAAQ